MTDDERDLLIKLALTMTMVLAELSGKTFRGEDCDNLSSLIFGLIKKINPNA